MPPVVLNYKLRNKQITIEHNFIKYSYSYMFRSHGGIIRLVFRTYCKKYTYRNVKVRSHFLQIYLQFSRSLIYMVSFDL